MNTAFVNGTTSIVRAKSAVSRNVSVKAKTNMSLASNMRKAAIAMPFVLPASALAAEGTGASLGVDDVLLLVPLLLVPGIFFALYIQFGRSQDNSEFFGDFDNRRF